MHRCLIYGQLSARQKKNNCHKTVTRRRVVESILFLTARFLNNSITLSARWRIVKKKRFPLLRCQSEGSTHCVHILLPFLSLKSRHKVEEEEEKNASSFILRTHPPITTKQNQKIESEDEHSCMLSAL